jgi:hypothetical protein
MKKLIVILLLSGCAEYEMPQIDNGAPPQGKHLSAYADGANYVLFYSDGDTIYQGAERHTDRIEIPDDVTEMWLVTVPATQDSVWLTVGCLRIKSVTKIRWKIR